MFHARLRFARVTVVAVAGASCLAAVACGGTTASSLGAAPRASSTPDPLATLTANEVEAKALADLKAAPSSRLTGTGTDSGGTVTFNLGFKPGHGCTGTVDDSNQGSFKLIEIGSTVYFNASSQFWKSQVGSDATALIALVDGRYIKVSANASYASSITGTCDLFQQITSQKVSETFTKEKLTSLGGIRVLPIVSSKADTMYVTDTNTPEITEIVEGKADGGPGKVTVSVGVPVTLSAPPASQVIDGSALGL